jgi:hypothetical protein
MLWQHPGITAERSSEDPPAPIARRTDERYTRRWGEQLHAVFWFLFPPTETGRDREAIECVSGWVKMSARKQRMSSACSFRFAGSGAALVPCTADRRWGPGGRCMWRPGVWDAFHPAPCASESRVVRIERWNPQRCAAKRRSVRSWGEMTRGTDPALSVVCNGMGCVCIGARLGRRRPFLPLLSLLRERTPTSSAHSLCRIFSHSFINRCDLGLYRTFLFCL